MRRTRRPARTNTAVRRNTESSTIPVIGTMNTPYGNFPIEFKKDIEAGYIVSTAKVNTGIEVETLNVRRLNDEASFYSNQGFFKDFPFDFERHPPGDRYRVNPRMRRNPDHEDANTSPKIPFIEFMGKKAGEPSLNWAKALFSLAPVDDEGNVLVVLKVFNGETDCSLSRADVKFDPDQLDYARTLFNQLVGMGGLQDTEAQRFRIIDSYLNPLAYANPRRPAMRRSTRRLR